MRSPGGVRRCGFKSPARNKSNPNFAPGEYMQFLLGKFEKPPELSLRVAAFALSAVATLAVELTMADAGAWPIWPWLKASALLLACVGAASFLQRRPGLLTPGVAIAALISVGLLPLVIEMFATLLCNARQPLDIVLLSSCRNLVLM